jgi:hypothetical protein
MTAVRIVPGLLALCFIAAAAEEESRPFPLCFEPNVGQTDPAVKFVSRGQNYTVFIRPGEVTLRSGSSVLRLTFIGANPNAELTGLDPVNSPVHYLIGDSEAWHRDVPVYRRLEYGNVYPSVDVVFHGDSSRRLEYDLILHPQAEPSQIRLRFEGAELAQTDSSGDMVLRTPAGIWCCGPQRGSGGTPVQKSIRLRMAFAARLRGVSWYAGPMKPGSRCGTTTARFRW